MKNIAAILFTSTALAVAVGVPVWSVTRADDRPDSASRPSTAALVDGWRSLPFEVASSDDRSSRERHRETSRRDHHDDDDDHEDDDHDDDDDDDRRRRAPGPVPSGTGEPPKNILFGTGTPPQVQVK